MDNRKTREDYVDYVKKLREALDVIREKYTGLIRMRLMTLDCREINELMCSSCKNCVDLILENMVARTLERNQRLVRRFEYIDSRLNRRPTDEEGLTELEADLDK